MSASTGALAENAHSELHTKGGDTQVAISALPKDSVPIGAVGVNHIVKVVDGVCESTGVFAERATAELRVKAGAVQANVELRHGRAAMLALMGHAASGIAGKFLSLPPPLDLVFSDIRSEAPAAGWAQIFACVGFCELISPTNNAANREAHAAHSCIAWAAAASSSRSRTSTAARR